MDILIIGMAAAEKTSAARGGTTRTPPMPARAMVPGRRTTMNEGHSAEVSIEKMQCNCCGGELPGSGVDDDIDQYDDYLVREDGYCPGYLCVDATGQVLGCGAWSAEAYK